MIRRFNYTERRAIPQTQVDIELTREDHGVPSYEARFDLDGLDLPEDALLCVEAYSRFGFMRFVHGTVGRHRVPEDRRLTAFEGTSRIQFRVKVIELEGRRGRLLAVADRLSPRDQSEKPGKRQPLLPVENRDLEDEVWTVDCSGDEPVVVLNARIPGIDSIARSSPTFGSLVFPAALRNILERILIVDDYTGTEEPEHIFARWLQFGSRFAGSDPPDSEEEGDSEKDEWIETAVRGFCRWYQARDRFENAFGPDVEE